MRKGWGRDGATIKSKSNFLSHKKVSFSLLAQIRDTNEERYRTGQTDENSRGKLGSHVGEYVAGSLVQPEDLH